MHGMIFQLTWMKWPKRIGWLKQAVKKTYNIATGVLRKAKNKTLPIVMIEPMIKKA